MGHLLSPADSFLSVAKGSENPVLLTFWKTENTNLAALPSPRERQEQLMGYRKRGPKPKPLVVQVNTLSWSGDPSTSLSLNIASQITYGSQGSTPIALELLAPPPMMQPPPMGAEAFLMFPACHRANLSPSFFPLGAHLCPPLQCPDWASRLLR